MNRRQAFLSVASAALAAPAILRASPAAALGGGDLRMAALMGGEFASQTSQLALRQGSPAIRQFAQLEINEQTGVAAAMGATPGSTPLRPDQAEMLNQLANMSGSRFNRMYVDGQIRGHRELLQIHEQIAQGGWDATARAASLVAVPAIQTHLLILDRLRRA